MESPACATELVHFLFGLRWPRVHGHMSKQRRLCSLCMCNLSASAVYDSNIIRSRGLNDGHSGDNAVHSRV